MRLKPIFSAAFLFLSTLVPAQDFNLEPLGHLPYGVELSDIWGYVDEEGNEYALVGMVNGVSVVDVTDPQNLENVFITPGEWSAWRDLSTWGDYAYVTCECGPGLLIIDLSPLPDTAGISYTYWVGDTFTFYKAHTLFIDDQGIAYIFGADHSAGGVIMLDLNTDPMNPEVVGRYDLNYIHDGVARGDTLWGAAIYEGELQVIDITDKANPMLISAWETPNAFTHNAWLSDDSRYLFTTDEVKNATVTAYDVTDVFNPIRLDQWKTNDTAIIPHNTHYLDGFLINSHYTIGVNIIDVSRPGNMIETGRYDTSPDYTYEGFHGCWGVYPFLPSGNIIASDMEEGLYVLGPTYVRGCYLEGQVTDLHTGGPVFFPTIEVLEDTLVEQGNIIGKYATATMNPGTYTVRVSANGYFPDTTTGVVLASGELTILDVQLNNWPAGLGEKDERVPIQVYPNPATDAVGVSVGQPGRLSLLDLNGKVIHEQRLQPGTTDVAFPLNMAKGMYLLEWEGNGAKYRKKLSVE